MTRHAVTRQHLIDQGYITRPAVVEGILPTRSPATVKLDAAGRASAARSIRLADELDVELFDNMLPAMARVKGNDNGTTPL